MRVFFQLVAFIREHIWHKALVMRCSMRLEIIRVCSLNSFQLVMGLCRGHPSLFLRVCLPQSALPVIYFLVFDTLCVCGCVLEYFGFHEQFLFFHSV